MFSNAHNVIVFMIVMLFLGTTTFAHNGKITGVVSDEATAQPLQYASVLIEGTSKTTVSDAFGHFSISGLQEQTYTLLVSFVGYAPQAVTVIIDELHPVDVRINLNPSRLELSEVSVSTSRRPQINTVSDVDFRLRPVRTTQDLLRNVPGLFIAQHAGGGKAEQIFLRGFDIDHGTDINLTVDGMPVNMVSHAHGQGYADLHFVIPETIESFQFGKGPYYTEIGDFGTAGYVAFKTRDAIEKNFVKAEAGNFSTYRAVGLLKMPFYESSAQQSGYFAGEYFASDGPFETPQLFKRYNVMAKYNWHINPRNKLTLSASWFYSKWDASGQVPDRAVKSGLISRFGSIDNPEGGNTARINLNIQHAVQLKDGATWRNQLYYSHYKFNLFSNFTFFLQDSIRGDQIRQTESRSILGYSTSLDRESHIGNMPLTMSVGAGFRYDHVDDITLEHTVARKPLNEFEALGDVRQLNSFVFWNNVLHLSSSLVLNGGARYDNISYTYNNRLEGVTNPKADASRISPKLGLSYLPSKNTRFFLNTGIGFHSNDARVAVPRQGDQILPPAYGADLGTTIKAWNKLIVTAALWTLYLDQEFVYVGDEGVVEAGGKTIRRGIDLSVRYQVLPWLYADVDLNYSHARGAAGEKGDNYIPLAPNFTSIGGMTAEFKSGFRGTLRYRYIADRPAVEDNSVIAKGYFINDLVVGYTKKRFDYTVSVENLLNTEWNEAQFNTESKLRGEAEPVSELHYTPGTPFSLKLGITYRF